MRTRAKMKMSLMRLCSAQEFRKRNFLFCIRYGIVEILLDNLKNVQKDGGCDDERNVL